MSESTAGDIDLSSELAFALDLADLADAFTLPRFEQADFSLGWKDDRTEVTEADRGAEQVMADHVLAHRPGHGFFGEEHGLQGDPDSAWRWIVDPIDGTVNFLYDLPVVSVSIAATWQGDVVAGAVTDVVREETFSACTAGGARLGARTTHGSSPGGYRNLRSAVRSGPHTGSSPFGRAPA